MCMSMPRRPLLEVVPVRPRPRAVPRRAGGTGSAGMASSGDVGATMPRGRSGARSDACLHLWTRRGSRCATVRRTTPAPPSVVQGCAVGLGAAPVRRRRAPLTGGGPRRNGCGLIGEDRSAFGRPWPGWVDSKKQRGYGPMSPPTAISSAASMHFIVLAASTALPFAETRVPPRGRGTRPQERVLATLESLLHGSGGWRPEMAGVGGRPLL